MSRSRYARSRVRSGGERRRKDVAFFSDKPLIWDRGVTIGARGRRALVPTITGSFSRVDMPILVICYPVAVYEPLTRRGLRRRVVAFNGGDAVPPSRCVMSANRDANGIDDLLEAHAWRRVY